MAREVSEWIGRNDNSMPGRLVRDRLCRKQDDRCANPDCRCAFGPKRRAECDHIRALIDGGENRETNLQMLCEVCHRAKTKAEAGARKKTRHIRENHILAREPSRLRSAGFTPPKPQRTASRKTEKWTML